MKPFAPQGANGTLDDEDTAVNGRVAPGPVPGREDLLEHALGAPGIGMLRTAPVVGAVLLAQALEYPLR